MVLLDHLTIPHPTGPRRIELRYGDLTRIPREEAVDVLVVSAFPDDYAPTPGSLIGALHQQGLSVRELAARKRVDLRHAFSSWLSEELGDTAERLGFRQLLCFEPPVRGAPAELVGDIFQGLMPFVHGDPPIRTVAMPLVASGDRRVPVEAMLPPLLEAAARWIALGMPLERLVIVERSEAKARELARTFAAFKEQHPEWHRPPAKEFAYDVFVSYSHQNADAADFVVAELRRLEPNLRVFVDREQLAAGDHWQVRVLETLDHCRAVVTMYSPAYLDSKICKEEFHVAYARHRNSDWGALVPIYLSSTDLPTFMALVQYVDCREADRTRLAEACRVVVQELDRIRQGGAKRGSWDPWPAPPSTAPSPTNRPQPSVLAAPSNTGAPTHARTGSPTPAVPSGTDRGPIRHWSDAVAFAAALHGDDERKGTRIPYLTHVMAVAEVLAYRYPERDHLVVAGLLHDVVEDTDASLATISRRFGDGVAHLVRAVSKDDAAMVAADGIPIPPKPRTAEDEADLWRRRREFMLAHLDGSAVDPDVLRLKAADAYCNLSAILRDLRDPAIGPSVWSRFKVGRDASLWFYDAIARAVEANIGDEPLARDLREALEAVRAAR